MNRRWIFHALLLLILVILYCVLPRIAPYEQDASDREAISAPVSTSHRLGTDALGRDRLTRLLFATRTSVTAAAVASLTTVALGLLVGMAGQLTRTQSIVVSAADALASIPGFLLVIILRGSLPLSISPMQSLFATFTLLALITWPATARLCLGFLNSGEMRRRCDFARAAGMTPVAVYRWVMLPALAAVAAAQFAILLPIFILSEADLGMLGLGAVEPLPSLGGMLRELVANSSGGGVLPWVPLLSTVALAVLFRQITRRYVDVAV
jgi:peptide/nickel transport system permease protein